MVKGMDLPQLTVPVAVDEIHKRVGIKQGRDVLLGPKLHTLLSTAFDVLRSEEVRNSC